MAGFLITDNGQIERNGLLVGAGTDYCLTGIDGLAGQPQTQSSSRPVALRHGHLAGRDFVTPRPIVLNFLIAPADPSQLSSRLDQLARAFGPTESPVSTAFRFPGVANGATVQADMTVVRRDVPIDLSFTRPVARAVVSFQLVAYDPRLYSLTLNSAGVSADAGTSPGASFDMTFDLGFGGAISPGSVAVTNLGTFGTWPTFRIDGPVTDPVVTNLTTGKALSFTTTLTAGQYLLVDTQARTVLLDGTSNRYSTLDAGSEWFELVPGVNDLRLSITGSDAAYLTTFYRDAYV